jgi:hypothetical protein
MMDILGPFMVLFWFALVFGVIILISYGVHIAYWFIRESIYILIQKIGRGLDDRASYD